MELDQALDAAKPIGRMQLMIALASVLMNIETGFITVDGVFLATVPPHHCLNLPGLLLNESVPIIDRTYSQCEEYINTSIRVETQPCSNGWEFDTEETGHSIVSDWELVCGRDYLPGLSQSFLVAGFGIGSLVGGPIADKYGRRPIIIVSLILFNAIGLAVSVVQSYALFVTLRFLAGFIFKGIRIPLMNLLFESLVPRHRLLIGTIPSGMMSVSLVMMAGIAYLIRDWRILNLVLMTPTIILMVFIWFVPESVRWLISQNEIEKAENVMQKIASFNGSEDFPSPALSEEEMALHSFVKVDCDAEHKIRGARVFLELFRKPTLTVTLILCWSWFTTALAFFGFALSTNSLPGSRYLTFFISSSTDVFALPVSLLAMKKFGCLRPLICGYSFSGIAMIGIVVLPYVIESEKDAYGILLIMFALVGRFFISFSIQPMILLVGDLFPTTMRNTGTAVVHLVGNIGSILSPQFLYLNKFFNNFSFVVMAICSFLGAGLCLLLPETSNTVQPETPADLQVLFDTKRLRKFGRGKPRGDDSPTVTKQENAESELS